MSDNKSHGLILLIFLFLFSDLSNTAQSNSRVDSLKMRLQNEKSDHEKINILNEITRLFSNTDPAKAMKNCDDAIALSVNINHPKGLANAYNNKGVLYYYNGDIQAALEYYLKSLEIREKIQDKHGLASSFNNIAALFKMQNDYSKALEYYMRSLKMANESGDKRAIAITLANIGNAYFHSGNDSLAEEYFNKVLAIDIEINDEKLLALAYGSIGKIYIERKEFNKAQDYLFKALAITEKINDKRNSVIHLDNIAHLYSTRGDYETMINYSLQSLELSVEMNLKSSMATAYANLAQAYAKKGNFKEAYNYEMLYADINDTIYKEENSRQMAEMQTKYETGKKQEEINRQKNVIEKRNYLIIGISIISILLAFGAALIIFLLRLQARTKSMLLQQKLLRTQMNPHFIFNVLSSLQGLIAENKPEDAMDYTSRFASLLRLILENSKEDYIYLNTEIKILENYLSLQKMRYNDMFEFSTRVICEKENMEEAFIPPMLAQPFIENAIEHGIIKKSAKGFIDVRFELTADSILFVVENFSTAPGHVPAEGNLTTRQVPFKKSTGEINDPIHKPMAVAITKERLFYLNKGHRNKIEFEFTEGEKTKVTFSIPVQKQ